MSIQVQKLTTFTGHRDSVYALAQGAQAEEIFSAGADGFVAKWNLADIAENEPVKGSLVVRVPASVYALCFIKEKNRLAVGQNYMGIHLIDLNDNKEIASSSITSSAIFDIQYNEEILFVACGDGTLSMLNINDLSTIKHLRLSAKSARCLAINLLKNELAIGYSDNFIRILDLETLEVKYEIAAHANSVFSLSYSPDNQYLLSGSRDAHLKVWRANEAYSLHESIVAHLFTINHIAYSPLGDYFATCSKDKAIKIWSAQDFKLLKVIDKSRHAGHGTSVNRLLWASYQNLLLSCSDDNTISVWQIF
jgi:WD40 repeat protein